MNVRQRKFADLVLKGVKSGTAYEQVYDAKGPAADACASKLLRNVKVEAYMDKVRKKSISSAVWSAQKLKENTCKMLKMTMEEGDAAGFKGLSDLLCKMGGYYQTQKLEVEVTQAGVMRAPLSANIEEWSAANAQGSQKHLMDAAKVIDVTPK